MEIRNKNRKLLSVSQGREKEGKSRGALSQDMCCSPVHVTHSQDHCGVSSNSQLAKSPQCGPQESANVPVGKRQRLFEHCESGKKDRNEDLFGGSDQLVLEKSESQ